MATDTGIATGGGDDSVKILETYLPSEMDAGDGYHTAYGKKGLDRCVAEGRVGCEL